MERPRILRLLRIAASAVCLIACGLFSLLWLRSYSRYDWLVGPLPRSYVFQSSTRPGGLEVIVAGPAFRVKLWELSSYPIQNDRTRSTVSRQPFLGFGWRLIQGRLRVTMPLWFPALSAGALAAALGLRTYRFSLRTLLLATTFVAVVLGLAAVFH